MADKQSSNMPAQAGSLIPVPIRKSRQSPTPTQQLSVKEHQLSRNDSSRKSDVAAHSQKASHIPLPISKSGSPTRVTSPTEHEQSASNSNPRRQPQPVGLGYPSSNQGDVAQSTQDSTRKMNLPETSSSASSLTSISLSTASTSSPIGTSLKYAASLASKGTMDPFAFEATPSASGSSSVSASPHHSHLTALQVHSPGTGLPAAASHTRPSALQAGGRPGGALSPAGLRVADESDMKKNLLEMISKSEKKRRKPRALPNLQGVPRLRSPITPDSSSNSPNLSPATGEMTSIGRWGPGTLLSPTRTSALASPPVSPMASAGVSKSGISAVKEVVSIESLAPLTPETVETTTVESPKQTSIPAAKMESETFSSASKSSADTQPEISYTKPLSSAEFLKLEGSFPVSPVTSEIMYHAKEEISSSGEIDTRNLMPLSSEMENTGAHKTGSPVSTDEISTGSENSMLASQTSLPTTLGKVSGSVHPLESTNLEQVIATSLPDLDSQQERMFSGSPSMRRMQLGHQQLLKSQLSSLQSEMEQTENKLTQSRAQAIALQVENAKLKSEAEKTKTKLRSLEESAEKDQEKIAELYHIHAEELAKVKREMGEQLKDERERLLNQIRELTVMKEQANAEVDELKGSLSEAQELATSSSTNLEKQEIKHQLELENLKIEMQALQELYEETEKSHSLLLKDNKKSEGKVSQLLSDNKTLEQKLSDLESSTTGNNKVELKLKEAQKRIIELQTEKSKAVLDVEQKATNDSVKMEVKHREAIDALQKQLRDAKSKISAQSHQLQQQAAHTRPTSPRDARIRPTSPRDARLRPTSPRDAKIRPASPRDAHIRPTSPRDARIRPVSPRDAHIRPTSPRDAHTTPASPREQGPSTRYQGDTIAFRNKRSNMMRHGRPASPGTPVTSPRRGAENKLDSNTGGDSVAAIYAMLEKEGYKPTEARTPEDVIVYLWRVIEQAREKLQEISKEKESMESRLRHADDQLVTAQLSSRSTHEILKIKLEEMLQKNHVAEEQSASMREKQNQVLSENQELKGKLISLRGRLTDKSMLLNHLEADLAGSRREADCSLKELSHERQQKSMLQSKVDSLKNRVVSQKRELVELEDEAKDKLTRAGSHVKQTRQEISALKAKIGELEGEVTHLKQQLSHATEQRDTLQMQLDSINAKSALLESQLHKELSKSREAQVRLDSLEHDSHCKATELQREISHRIELEREIISVRRDLKMAKENISSLESQLLLLQAEHDRCNTELSKTASNALELKRKLESTTADLTRYQELARKLQDTITVTQNDLETTTIHLQMEKQNNKELQAMVDALNGTLERSGRKLEGIDLQFAQNKKELLEKKLEIQQMIDENHTLRFELKTAHNNTSSMQTELERRERELRSQDLELTQSKETATSLAQKLTLALATVDNYKHQLEQYQDQLTSNTAKLAKDTKINEMEMESLKMNLMTTSKQLSGLKEQLSLKEDEVRILKQEKMSLTGDLSECKREALSLSTFKTKLENDMSLTQSHLDAEHTRILKVEAELQRKMETVKSLEAEVEKLRCGLMCEKEQNTTLGIEQTSALVELQKAKSENVRVLEELKKVVQDSQAKSERDQLLVTQLQNELSFTSNQLSSLNTQHNLLQGESRRDKQRLETIGSELADTTKRMSAMTSDLATLREAKEILQKQIGVVREQLEKATTALAQKISSQEQTNSKLSMCQSQLSHALQESEEAKLNLDSEKANSKRLQHEIERAEDSMLTIKLELEQSKEEREYERKRAETLSSDLAIQQKKTQDLNSDLDKAQQELMQQRDAAAEARDSFTHNINMLRTTHEEDKEAWRTENATLKQENTETREKLFSTKKKLDVCENQLAVNEVKLTSAEEKCNQLEARLTSKSHAHNTLESNHLQLESTHTVTKTEIAEMNKRLSLQTAEAEKLRVELRTATQECQSLKDRLQQQKEAAATSLNRIQRQSQEKSTELHGKIQQLSDKVKEAHIGLREAQGDLMSVKAEKNSLCSCVKEESEKSRLLKDQLQQQMTELKLVEDQVTHLQKTDEREKNSKVQLQHALSDEIQKRQNTELIAAEHRQVIASTSLELKECKKFLTKECGINNHLKKELHLFKNDLSHAKKQLDTLRGMQKSSQHQGEVELSKMRQKYHAEKKLLKERVRELQAELEASSTLCKNRGDEAGKLMASNKILTENHKEAVRKLTNTEQRLQDKKEECNMLKIKLQASEVQVTQLQSEIGALERAQIQVDEFKKKHEVKAKKDMQKVLAEVTDHMEQQYTAHRYLEKLRNENEGIAIKEKERIISQLKDELKQKKQENKHDRLRLEQMQLESSFLKNQHKEQDRSRRRLESRLEQVNDTLSRSLPRNPLNSMSAGQLSASGSLFTSTPLPNRFNTSVH